jgi:hypothetical protein
MMQFDKIKATEVRYKVVVNVSTFEGDIELEYEGDSYEQFLTKVREFQQQVTNRYEIVKSNEVVPF